MQNDTKCSLCDTSKELVRIGCSSRHTFCESCILELKEKICPSCNEVLRCVTIMVTFHSDLEKIYLKNDYNITKNINTIISDAFVESKKHKLDRCRKIIINDFPISYDDYNLSIGTIFNMYKKDYIMGMILRLTIMSENNEEYIKRTISEKFNEQYAIHIIAGNRPPHAIKFLSENIWKQPITYYPR